MKTIAIFCLGSVLLGCAPVPTLEQLEDAAMLTGDWSQVERRERIIQRREARQALQCPLGYISYCEPRIGREDCVCVGHDALDDIFAVDVFSDW